ncbi:NAD(P)-dependent dehydrogenase, short-chain alcohol dehydrogenase family [Roseomonas rosea]|uniref:NAD(P)-dependent dehydrogenase, short-chain alcohol dehydrogenase family n=1 Tax=Muricoccus roseus TaxID=198092 RepID=A0A1M6IFZ4_9PROT|nr:SDR family oxidoreductase [Roseomonas rosea]SHJ33372.1 NAD(P)-dependent dehydrogenase, short-chain alcohol dehydrogenase family [Roseomonas rosea]
MRLNGKLAVITAAASGMGRAGVECFVREGARVAAVDINADALAVLVRELGPNGEVVPVQADLSTEEGARGSINRAAEALGGIDILWAHAGIPGPASVENLDLKQYELAMTLNVTSAVLAAGEVAKHMRRRGGGSLIFTSSVSGLVGSMMSPVYSTAKFAVVGLGKSLALNLAPDRIRVNVLCPGLTETPMMNGFIGRSGDPAELAANGQKYLTAIPLGRFGHAEDVALAALWLASDEATYVTGVALPVDGGYTCR